MAEVSPDYEAEVAQVLAELTGEFGHRPSNNQVYERIGGNRSTCLQYLSTHPAYAASAPEDAASPAAMATLEPPEAQAGSWGRPPGLAPVPVVPTPVLQAPAARTDARATAPPVVPTPPAQDTSHASMIIPDWRPVEEPWRRLLAAQAALEAALERLAQIQAHADQAAFQVVMVERRQALGLTMRWQEGMNHHEVQSLERVQARWDPALVPGGGDSLPHPWAEYEAWRGMITRRRQELGLSGTWDHSLFEARRAVYALQASYEDACRQIRITEQVMKQARTALAEARQAAIHAAQQAWVLAHYPALAQARQQAEGLQVQGVRSAEALLRTLAGELESHRREAPTWANDGPGAEAQLETDGVAMFV